MYVSSHGRRRVARVGLGGLLSAQQVYDYARGAGFPPATARQMVAIAQRESSFQTDPGVGTISPLETSYGLWQINWKDSGNRAMLQANGITSPDQLLDPATNARAAALLWGGNDANLNTAWAINRYGLQYSPAEKYQSNLAALPGVDQFESGYDGSGDGAGGGLTWLDSIVSGSFGDLLPAEMMPDFSNPWVLAGSLFVGVLVLSSVVGGRR